MFYDLSEKKLSHHRIWCVPLGDNGEIYCFRGLSFREYSFYQKALSLNLIPRESIITKIFEDIILNAGVADQINILPAGVVFSIVELTLFLSGNPFHNSSDVKDLDEGLNYFRQQLDSNINDFIFAFILVAFDCYTLEDLENLDWIDLMKLFVIAEKKQKLEEPIKFFNGTKKKDLVSEVLSHSAQAKQIDSTMNLSNKKEQLLYEDQKKKEMVRRIREKQAQKHSR